MSDKSTIGKDLERISSPGMHAAGCADCVAHVDLIEDIGIIKNALIRADERSRQLRRWAKILVPVATLIAGGIANYMVASQRENRQQFYQLHQAIGSARASLDDVVPPPVIAGRAEE